MKERRGSNELIRRHPALGVAFEDGDRLFDVDLSDLSDADRAVIKRELEDVPWTDYQGSSRKSSRIWKVRDKTLWGLLIAVREGEARFDDFRSSRVSDCDLSELSDDDRAVIKNELEAHDAKPDEGTEPVVEGSSAPKPDELGKPREDKQGSAYKDLEGMREWTSKNGRFTCRAKLVYYQDSVATLLHDSGKITNVPLTSLNLDDRKQVGEYARTVRPLVDITDLRKWTLVDSESTFLAKLIQCEAGTAVLLLPNADIISVPATRFNQEDQRVISEDSGKPRPYEEASGMRLWTVKESGLTLRAKSVGNKDGVGTFLLPNGNTFKFPSKKLVVD